MILIKTYTKYMKSFHFVPEGVQRLGPTSPDSRRDSFRVETDSGFNSDSTILVCADERR